MNGSNQIKLDIGWDSDPNPTIDIEFSGHGPSITAHFDYIEVARPDETVLDALPVDQNQYITLPGDNPATALRRVSFYRQNRVISLWRDRYPVPVMTVSMNYDALSFYFKVVSYLPGQPIANGQFLSVDTLKRINDVSTRSDDYVSYLFTKVSDLDQLALQFDNIENEIIQMYGNTATQEQRVVPIPSAPEFVIPSLVIRVGPFVRYSGGRLEDTEEEEEEELLLFHH